MGILFALTALFSWGLGDFLIQRSARKFGDWIALFYVTAFSAVLLFPFVYHDLGSALTNHGPFLWIASGVILLAALFDFEALRVGKISIVEPIYALEIPITAVLALIVLHERLSHAQVLLVAFSMIGTFLISTRSFSHFKKIHLEKGIWYAFIAMIGMGLSSFLFGVGSRAINPLMINWFTSAFMACVSFLYLLATSRLHEVMNDFQHHKRLIVNMAFFDTLAWVTFSYACLSIPIAIATSISEGYIILGGALGLVFNREKLKRHQLVGFFLAVVSVIILSIITDT